MLSKTKTLTFSGIDIVDIQVQTHISKGIPYFNIVGLPDKTIAESKERVRSALHSIALDLPPARIIVNLSPADLMKEGSHFDLPIALSILASMGVIPEEELEKYIIIGELGLDASILGVNGTLPAAIGANSKNLGIICSACNAEEAAWSGNESILAPKGVLSLINHFKGIQTLSTPQVTRVHEEVKYADFKDVIGQTAAKRAIEIAASGGHNMLMIGSPGSGKSMLAERLPGILPSMNSKEVLETSMIYSVAGKINNGNLIKTRPFRSPHSSSSMVAIVGGGHSKKIFPGEISLSHNGVLFLDEFPEFPRDLLESLRQPLENKKINISRANNNVTYPAKFQLIAAMNHCKCGNFRDANKSCARVPRCNIDYQNKISGPIMDRIDIIIEVSDINEYDVSLTHNNETSESIAKRVLKARTIQKSRYNKYEDITLNSELNGDKLHQFAMSNEAGKALLNKFAKKHKISMRSYYRIMRLSRTIADVESSETIELEHIAEAISYKSMTYA